MQALKLTLKGFRGIRDGVGLEEITLDLERLADGAELIAIYRNGEIKTLLADLPGQEEIRAIGHKAAEVARLLKAGLVAIRQEQSGLAHEIAAVEAARQRLYGADSRVAGAEGAPSGRPEPGWTSRSSGTPACRPSANSLALEE